jgi:hypothetical protein
MNRLISFGQVCSADFEATQNINEALIWGDLYANRYVRSPETRHWEDLVSTTEGPTLPLESERSLYDIAKRGSGLSLSLGNETLSFPVSVTRARGERI